MSKSVASKSNVVIRSRERNSLLELVFTGITDPVFVIDPHLMVIDCNDAAVACLNLTIKDVVGAKWSDLFPQPEQTARDTEFDKVIHEGVEWQGRIPVRDIVHGGSRLYDVKSYPVRKGRRASDTVSHVVVYMHEVTDEVRTYLELVDRNRELALIKERLEEKTALLNNANQELSQNFAELQDENSRLNIIAVVDVMTGLPNYRAFHERLHAEIKHTIMSGRPMSLLLFDVDNFKQYNDQFGHPQGDELLRQIAMLLRDNIRSSDFPARYGGEEFAILLPRTDKFGGVVVAERIRTKIADYPMPNRRTTISIGIAEFPADTQSVDDLIAQADKAMYVAKSYGKNTTCLWSRERHLSYDRVGISESLKDAECVPVVGHGQNRLNGSATRRVLIVDKDELLLATLRAALQECGYSVVTAGTGRTALTKLAEAAGTFDAMITDVSLPDRTGFELREQANALQDGLPIVYMSGLSAKTVKRSNAEDAAVDFLEKPFTISSLVGTLNNLIDKPMKPVALAA